jgi:hypothetical protein
MNGELGIPSLLGGHWHTNPKRSFQVVFLVSFPIVFRFRPARAGLSLATIEVIDDGDPNRILHCQVERLVEVLPPLRIPLSGEECASLSHV